MGAVIWAHLRRAPGRALALLLGVVVAATGFTVLTGTARASQLEVKGTVRASFRGSYDVLVRPAGSRNPLEQSQGLVRANYLSGIVGGISQAQWHTVQGLPGVAVAAPLAVVGYTVPAAEVPIPVAAPAAGQPPVTYRVGVAWTSDRGLTRVADGPAIAYVTTNRLTTPTSFSDVQVTTEQSPAGSRPVCSYPVSNPDQSATAAFGTGTRTTLTCSSTVNGAFGLGRTAYAGLSADQVGVSVEWPFPLLVAGVDPASEAKLDQLDGAVDSGRYLRAADTGHLQGGNLVIPALAANRPDLGEQLTATVQQLPAAQVAAATGGKPLNSFTAAATLRNVSGPTVQTVRRSASEVYPLLLDQARSSPVSLLYAWTPGQTRYGRTSTGGLSAEPLPPLGTSTWQASITGSGYALVPMEASDTPFRPLTQHQANNQTSTFPQVEVVGTFDANRLQSASSVTSSLQTFNDPDLRPGDARTADLLGGQSLLPNGNLAGYAQPAPQLLTTLGGVDTLQSSIGVPAGGPISVIRVRVAGAVGFDPASRERIRLVAQQIQQATGLDVDITLGSSTAPQTVTLPAGRLGRPELTLAENWTKKGVALAIVDAVDRKSLILFILVLVVCALFVTNTAFASVRTRITELGVLACLGWRPRRLFAVVAGELLLLGAGAGTVSMLLSVPLGHLVGAPVTWGRAALAIPASVVLALLAGLVPAASAARAVPMEAVRSTARPPRRASRVRRVSGLAWATVRRRPGRAALAALGLVVAVAAFTLLLAVTLAFRGTLVGTVLGGAVAVQVRGVDYAATAATLFLAGLGVADVLYISLHERAAEFATLRAVGWRESALARLLVTEGTVIGAAGALVGAALGLVAVAVFASVTLAVLAGAAIAAATGVLIAVVASTVTVAALGGLPTVELLSAAE